MQQRIKSRLLIVIPAALLALYALSFAIGKYYLTPDYIKHKLTTYLENKFQKKVNVVGNINFNVSWDIRPHVIIEKIQIQDTLNIQNLDLSFSLIKLLFKEINIESLTIRQAQIAGLNIYDLTLEDLYLDENQTKGELNITKLITDAASKDSGFYTIPNDELPLKHLIHQKLNLQVKIKQLLLGSLPLKNVSIKLFSKDQKLTMVFKPPATLANGNLNLEIDYDMKPKTPALKVKMFTKSLTLESFMQTIFNKSPVAGSDLAITADLNSTGTNLRALVSNLHGKILATSGPGEYLNSNAASLGNLLSSILAGMITFDKRQSSTSFECAVMNFKVNNGIADATNGIALQAASVNVLGSGKVDLRNGQINFSINPQNLSNSNNPIDITQFSIAQSITINGSISNPKVSFNPLSAITSGTLNKTILSSMAAGLPGGIAAIAGGMVAPKQTTILAPCKTALER